jgi:serine/threonine protein kinase
VYRGAPPAWWDATAKSKAVIGLIAGMALVHSFSLVHRDLKPEHILIDGKYEVRITGFGNARAVAPQMSMKSKPEYTAAPETYNTGGYTNKVDVFSFGVTLYLLWADGSCDCNGLPWKFPGPFVLRICAGERWGRPPGVSDFYWNLIQDCWNTEPADRPAFADMLRVFEQDRRWLFDGTDAAELADYEARVRNGVAVPENPKWSPSGGAPATTTPPTPPPDLHPPRRAQEPPPLRQPESPVEPSPSEKNPVVHRHPDGKQLTKERSTPRGSPPPPEHGSKEDLDRPGVVHIRNHVWEICRC